MKKKECWYSTDITPKEMVRGARGELFPKLEHSDHFSILNQLVDLIPQNLTWLELGCGAGDIGRVFQDKYLRYTGADFPHIINKVARVVNPNQDYAFLDVYDTSTLKPLLNVDVIITNALFDILENPIEALENVLCYLNKYVLIHRQEFCGKHSETHIYETTSYGGLMSYHSVISQQDFDDVCDKFAFKTIKELSFPHWKNTKSILLKNEVNN